MAQEAVSVHGLVYVLACEEHRPANPEIGHQTLIRPVADGALFYPIYLGDLACFQIFLSLRWLRVHAYLSTQLPLAVALFDRFVHILHGLCFVLEY